MIKVIQWNHPAARWLADLPRQWCHIRDSVLVSACWQIGLSTMAIVRLALEWKSMLLSPCITSIPATKATLGDDRGG